MNKEFCEKCNGYPCVCEEEKTYMPVWACYMWIEEENTMILLNDIPLSPRLRRTINNSVELK